MIIEYLPLHFTLKFKNPVCVDVNPLFAIRGVFGYNLRKLSCANKNSICSSCCFAGTCAYAIIFETITEKSNTVLPGVDRVSHPFSFKDGNIINRGKFIDSYTFTMTLFGKGIDYLPYIHESFIKAGTEGLFKSRIPFDVECQTSQDSLDIINFDVNKTLNQFEAKEIHTVAINIISPLRFKVNGSYTTEFSGTDFMKCLNRRFCTMVNLYGTGNYVLKNYNPSDIRITDKKLYWEDKRRYSARQKKSMELGGINGSFILRGDFTPYELTLLTFASIANVGKNSSFGLGDIEVFFFDKEVKP